MATFADFRKKVHGVMACDYYSNPLQDQGYTTHPTIEKHRNWPVYFWDLAVWTSNGEFVSIAHVDDVTCGEFRASENCDPVFFVYAGKLDLAAFGYRNTGCWK